MMTGGTPMTQETSNVFHCIIPSSHAEPLPLPSWSSAAPSIPMVKHVKASPGPKGHVLGSKDDRLELIHYYIFQFFILSFAIFLNMVKQLLKTDL